MKKVIRLKCESCDCSRYLNTGMGRNFPSYYLEMTDFIKQGECGPEYKEFFKENPGAAVDLEDDAYFCEGCGKISRMPHMSLYVHNDNQEDTKGYITPEELIESGNYKLVREYSHKCPDCGDNMTLLATDTEKRYKCPQCREDALLAILVK